MTALSADRNYLSKKGEVKACPMEQSETIYKGSLVGNDADGYAIPASDTSGQVFRGVSIENKVADASADGTFTVRCQKKGEVQLTYGAAGGAASQALVGTVVEVVDSGTVDTAAHTTNHVKVGPVTEVLSGTSVMVDISGYAV